MVSVQPFNIIPDKPEMDIQGRYLYYKSKDKAGEAGKPAFPATPVIV